MERRTFILNQEMRSDHSSMLMFLNIILKNINEGICVIDNEGIVVFWNKKCEELYGIKKDVIIGKNIIKHFPNALCIKVLKTGKMMEYVKHRPRKNSVVVSSAIPIEKEGEVIGILTVDHDITKIARLNRELEEANNKLKYLEYVKEELNKIHGNMGFESIIYKDKKMYDLIMLASKLAKSDATVMVLGESGTGKDLFARAIHQTSIRRDKPFVVVDCSSIPPNLMESELFGYEPGAFTGAKKGGKPGKFEIANKGTIFLDEIGELPLEMQSKLLRVLENHEFYRVGGLKPVKIDARVISATNRDLPRMIEKGKFREDLFFRLGVVTLKIPPLRERREDILPLIEYFMKIYSAKNKKVVEDIEPQALEIMMKYNWPGNVRELKNIIERLVILTENGVLCAEHLPKHIKDISQTFAQDTKVSDDGLRDVIYDNERKIIADTLKACNFNKSKTARVLDIPRSTLYYKMKKLNINSNLKS